MLGDAAELLVPGLDARRIVAEWEASTRHKFDGTSCIALVVGVLDAIRGRAKASIRLAAASASYGARHAAKGGALSVLIDDIDQLETLLLDRLADITTAGGAAVDAPRLIALVKLSHACFGATRRAAAAGYANTASAATRKRARLARNDIANAIGGVRNAVLLMDGEQTAAAKEHFRAIAKRNVHTAELLARSHLSDEMAHTAALGWQDVTSADMVVAAVPEAGARSAVNVAALRTMVDALRAAGDGVEVAVSPTSSSGTVAVATVQLLSIDGDVDELLIESLRQLASALGFTLAWDAGSEFLRILIPLSARDEGNDLRGAGQGEHVQSLGF